MPTSKQQCGLYCAKKPCSWNFKVQLAHTKSLMPVVIFSIISHLIRISATATYSDVLSQVQTEGHCCKDFHHIPNLFTKPDSDLNSAEQ